MCIPHTASLCWLRLFLFAPLLLPNLHTLLAELMRLQTAHSTDAAQKPPLLLPSVSILLTDHRPPPPLQASSILSQVLPGIQRWHKWNAQLFIAGMQIHITRGEPCMGEKEKEEGKEKIQDQKSRRQKTLMRHDSLTELGHAYWKQSSNANRHPPKPSRKLWTRGKGVPQRHWKRVKRCGQGD